MSERGYVMMSRKAYADDPFWLEVREFSKWEAWEDLIQMAAWKPRRYAIGLAIEELQRGEFVASVRFLAKRWKWTKDRVFRYLAALENMRRLTRQREGQHGVVYALVNYERYQGGATLDETANATPDETPARQPRDSNATKQKKSKKSKEEEATPVSVRPTNWVTAVGRIYLTETGGALNFGEAGRHFAPLLQHHGEAEFLRVWTAACQWAKRHGKIARLKPSFFASDFGEHQGRAGDPNTCEMTDDYGVMRLHHRDPITGEWVPGEPVETAA